MNLPAFDKPRRRHRIIRPPSRRPRPPPESRSPATRASSLEDYRRLDEAALLARAAAAKARLGRRAVILGHHYQADEILRLADFEGDSLELSRRAAAEREAEFIVFCGVHFMAETADVLRGERQQVILPDLNAGCSMAAMAPVGAVEELWENLSALDLAEGTVPVVYVNSVAAVKAFAGRRGGAACTSANAQAFLRWALGAGQRVLFIPDEHLGRNTAIALGVAPEELYVYDRRAGLPEEDRAALERARVILWQGFCSVHQVFEPADCARVRRELPGVTIIVHPECPQAIVRLADRTGSTGQILRAVQEAPPGSSWAVGTEAHLVARLARRFPDRRVVHLGAAPAVCPTMLRIDPAHLAWALENLVAGQVVNRVTVAPELAAEARVALERMLAATTAKPA